MDQYAPFYRVLILFYCWVAFWASKLALPSLSFLRPSRLVGWFHPAPSANRRHRLGRFSSRQIVLVRQLLGVVPVIFEEGPGLFAQFCSVPLLAKEFTSTSSLVQPEISTELLQAPLMKCFDQVDVSGKKNWFQFCCCSAHDTELTPNLSLLWC